MVMVMVMGEVVLNVSPHSGALRFEVLLLSLVLQMWHVIAHAGTHQSSPPNGPLVRCVREEPHSRRVRVSVPLVARPWLLAAGT